MGRVYAGPVYLDSSVIIGWMHPPDRLGARAQAFCADQLVGGVQMLVSVPALDEALYRLCTSWVAKRLNMSPQGLNLGRYLKQNRGELRRLRNDTQGVVNQLRAWTTLAFGGSASVEDIVDSWIQRFTEIDGMRDALHLSLAEHLGAATIATGDGDFARLRTLPYPLEVVLL